MTTALEGDEWSASRPGRSLPPGKTRYSLYRRVGGLQGRSGQVRKSSTLPGFDSRTVQLVVSRYIDWSTRPTSHNITQVKLNNAGAKPALHGSPDSPVKSLHSRVSVDPWVPSSPALHPHTTSALPATVILWNHVTVYWISASLWTRQRK
jgi:hypothetical protein